MNLRDRVRLAFVGMALLALAAAPVWAATITYVGPADGSWHNAANWELDGLPAGREPSSALGDTVNLGGATVHVIADASLSSFNAGGTVEIDDGGTLTGGSNVVRYISAINVNDGGTLAIPTTANIRTTVTVNEGGNMTGGGGISLDSRTLIVNGTWSPRGTTAADSFTVGSSTKWARVDMGATGTVILDVFGNGANEYFDVRGMTAVTLLDMADGTVQLRLQDGYVPQVGDSFDLWNLATDSLATMNIGDGSNIVLDGYALDASRWASDGIVTVMPEPTTIALLGAGLAMISARRKKVG